MDWITAREFEDITYKKCNGVARIALTDQMLEMHSDLKQLQNYTKLFTMHRKILRLE